MIITTTFAMELLWMQYYSRNTRPFCVI